MALSRRAKRQRTSLLTRKLPAARLAPPNGAVGLWLWLWLWLWVALGAARGRRAGLDVVVCYAAFWGFLREGVVGGGRLRVAVDNVPGVQQPREEPETAEGEVYEGVGAADAAFDPD